MSNETNKIETNEELATVRIKGSKTSPKSFLIPAPPEDPTYHERSAGLVGDYRSIEDRRRSER